MIDLKLKNLEGSDLISIAAALINIEHPVIELGEETVTTEDEVYDYILHTLAFHGIKCYDDRRFSDKLKNYEYKPFKRRFDCMYSTCIKSIIMHIDTEIATGEYVVCVRILFR